VAQRVTGAAISVHTAAHAVEVDSALEVADILESAGADLTRVVMCHLDTSLHRPCYHREVLARGAVIEYDLFGHEFFESENDFQSYGDTETARALVSRVEEGWGDQLLMSHDVCYKIQLTAYGGYGYAHILRNIVLRLRLLGLDVADINRIIMGNPRRIFPLQGNVSPPAEGRIDR
ncbi:MAG: phosphotriesterase-related protein, partial [Propionibacteriales bacterium]|nr:phosphotriesterase-related protein [Propionibacteriales bacterium]